MPRAKGGKLTAPIMVYLTPEQRTFLDSMAHRFHSGNKSDAIRWLLDNHKCTQEAIDKRHREIINAGLLDE